MTHDKKCSQCRVRDAVLVDEGGLPKCYECEVRLQGTAIQLLRDMLATSQSAAASARADFILVEDRLNGLLASEASRRSEVDRLRVALDAANAALANATDDLGAAQNEIDALRADLKRYTDVYGDPDAPVDVSSFAVGKPDAPPLFPELAAMADRVIASMAADAPRIKVGDHVRCESLGNLTGIVARITSTQSGGAGCIVRDDEMGHEWFATADLLEVLP